MLLTRTPLRISLGGGGTDLPFYCDRFGASLITAAINKYIFITVNGRLNDEYKINYSKTEIVKSVKDIKHNLIREALQLLEIKEPLEIHSMAEIPSETGLGSSSSFLIGLLNVLYHHKGEIVSRYKLAEDASTIMMDILKEPCGKQDQYAAAFGGICHLKISTSGRVSVNPLNIRYDSLKELEKNLMLFYTGFQRSANDILGHQKEKAEQKTESEIYGYYHEIKKIGDQSLKSLEKGDLRRFGEWMNIHWDLKRKISDKMSNPKIDEWYTLALANGALGGKLIGAGGGGFLMLYVEKNHDKIKELMAKEGLLYTTFKFDFDGSKLIYNGKYF